MRNELCHDWNVRWRLLWE